METFLKTLHTKLGAILILLSSVWFIYAQCGTEQIMKGRDLNLNFY